MGEQRGLTREQIQYILNDLRMKKLIEEKDLFLGIRDNYFNLYFLGSSVGKFEWSQRVLQVKTHQKYLGEDYVAERHWKGDGSQYRSIPLDDFLEQYTKIMKNIKRVQSGKGWWEKNAQQALILANNRNPGSAWYCVDMEYAQARKSRNDPNYGRCDIIAVRRQPDGEGRRQVALIELKVGCGSYISEFPGENKEWLRERIKSGTFSIFKYGGSLGSGVVGHLADFCRFEAAGQYERLKAEVCTILNNKRDLNLAIPIREITPDSLAERPQFYFLTLWTEKAPFESCRNSMYHYLGIAGYGGLAGCNADNVLGSTFRGRDNYHFLFAPLEMSEREAVDILGEKDIRPL